MAIQKTEGILLRKADLRETSLILTFYTKDFGKIKGIVRGVRGPRSGSCGGASMEIFALDGLVFYERRRSDIFTISCNLAGICGISIPCGFTKPNPSMGLRTRLPIGLQILGKPFAEATILRAAYAYEQATEWHQQRPSVVDHPSS